jgi:hypothetical protein
MILSGMSNQEQLEKNLATFAENRRLNEAEMKALLDIAEKMLSVGTVPCMSGGELTAEVTADYLRREHLPDRAFSSEKARYHRPAGTMPEEGVVIQRRYNKSQAA